MCEQVVLEHLVILVVSKLVWMKVSKGKRLEHAIVVTAILFAAARAHREVGSDVNKLHIHLL